VKYFKISSSDITNLPLIEKIAETKKPVILSTGASNKIEIKRALKILKKKTNKIILLHCILNYPTNKYDANLNMILDLKKLINNIGLSDHTLPMDSHEILIYAYIIGARYFEKHFTDNKKKPGNDHFHSFDKKDLKLFFKKLSHVKKILGSNKKYSLKSEKISRQNARRSIFYNKDLESNSKIKTSDLIMLRPAIGLNPFNYKDFIGKILKSNKKKGDLLNRNDFK
jgi:N-acetylneuraminate synthase